MNKTSLGQEAEALDRYIDELLQDPAVLPPPDCDAELSATIHAIRRPRMAAEYGRLPRTVNATNNRAILTHMAAIR